MEKTQIDKSVFTLVDDFEMKTSRRWSPRAPQRIFDTYVIDPQGKVKAVLIGSLKQRPNSELVIKRIKGVVKGG